MSRDKQIEEISCIIYAGKTIGTPCVAIANVLYDQGYRKSTDVAEEIFAEIEHTAKAAIILLRFEKDEKIRSIKTECYTDLIGYIAELKKKYTEEGK